MTGPLDWLRNGRPTYGEMHPVPETALDRFWPCFKSVLLHNIASTFALWLTILLLTSTLYTWDFFPYQNNAYFMLRVYFQKTPLLTWSFGFVIVTLLTTALFVRRTGIRNLRGSGTAWLYLFGAFTGALLMLFRSSNFTNIYTLEWLWPMVGGTTLVLLHQWTVANGTR